MTLLLMEIIFSVSHEKIFSVRARKLMTNNAIIHLYQPKAELCTSRDVSQELSLC